MVFLKRLKERLLSKSLQKKSQPTPSVTDRKDSPKASCSPVAWEEEDIITLKEVPIKKTSST